MLRGQVKGQGTHGGDAGHVDLHVSAGPDGKNPERRALEAAKHAGAHSLSPAADIQTHRRDCRPLRVGPLSSRTPENALSFL